MDASLKHVQKFYLSWLLLILLLPVVVVAVWQIAFLLNADWLRYYAPVMEVLGEAVSERGILFFWNRSFQWDVVHVVSGIVILLTAICYIGGSLCWSRYFIALWWELFPDTAQWWAWLAWLKVIPVLGQLLIWPLFVFPAACKRSGWSLTAAIVAMDGVLILLVTLVWPVEWLVRYNSFIGVAALIAFGVTYKLLSPGRLPRWGEALLSACGGIIAISILLGIVQVYRVDRQYVALQQEMRAVGIPSNLAELEEAYCGRQLPEDFSWRFLKAVRPLSNMRMEQSESLGDYFDEEKQPERRDFLAFQTYASAQLDWIAAENGVLESERPDDDLGIPTGRDWYEKDYIWVMVMEFYAQRIVDAADRNEPAEALRLYRLSGNLWQLAADNGSFRNTENNEAIRLEALAYLLGRKILDIEGLDALLVELEADEATLSRMFFDRWPRAAAQWVIGWRENLTGQQPMDCYDDLFLSLRVFKNFPLAIGYYFYAFSINRSATHMVQALDGWKEWRERRQYRTLVNNLHVLVHNVHNVHNTLLGYPFGSEEFSLAQIARIRLAKLAVVIEKFRLQRGRLPDSLEELKDDMPPIKDLVPDGKFYYHRTDWTIVVASNCEAYHDVVSNREAYHDVEGYRLTYQEMGPGKWVNERGALIVSFDVVDTVTKSYSPPEPEWEDEDPPFGLPDGFDESVKEEEIQEAIKHPQSTTEENEEGND